jgi:ribonuclease J
VAQQEKKAAMQQSDDKSASMQNGESHHRRPSYRRGSSASRKTSSTSRKENQPDSAAQQQGQSIAQDTAPAQSTGSKQGQRSPTRRTTRSPRQQRKTPVRIISLGGLGEIGKNIYLYECSNDIIVVDCGLAFPDDELLGVDLVIPDFSYLERNRDKVRGVVLTHGHEDHIGSLPYLLKRLNVPVYGTQLTLGLLAGKLREHGILESCQLNVVKPKDTVKMGCMAVEFIHVNHSIPDACALAIHTPAGVIVHTGDFKIDYSPIQGGIIDLARFGELGSKGVLALMGESTNVERPGHTTSERKVGESFEALFTRAERKRIIIATFASNIHRIQQIISAAVQHKRKVAISGRSMVNATATALELGYLDIPDGILVDIDTIGRYSDEQMVIITTGSQGEPMSALSRMALSDHRKVVVTPNDFIIISATPIPGNEKTVGRVVNELMKLGAEVIYEKMYEVHSSGHACQDELKLMLGLTRPKFFIPVHGEYKHMKKHAELAMSIGVAPDHIFISDVGKVLETDGVDMKFIGTVPAGRILVDGLGVGDVGSIVLRDRKHLAQDGLIVVVVALEAESGFIVAGPDIISRGFVYVREAESMMTEARKVAREIIEDCCDSGTREWTNIKMKLKDDLSDFFYNQTKRSPMILPVIQQV